MYVGDGESWAIPRGKSKRGDGAGNGGLVGRSTSLLSASIMRKEVSDWERYRINRGPLLRAMTKSWLGLVKQLQSAVTIFFNPPRLCRNTLPCLPCPPSFLPSSSQGASIMRPLSTGFDCRTGPSFLSPERT